MIRRALFLFHNIFRFPVDFLKGNNISLSSKISHNVKISKSTIGRNTYVSCNVVINNSQIGNYCSIAPGVQVGGMEHSYWWLSTSTSLSEYGRSNKKVIIGNDVWIAAGSIIKLGVTIGDGSVIGAMSFVNKDVPENSIVFGIPAKVYKRRFDPEVFKRLKETRYWEFNAKRAKCILEEFEAQNVS